MVPEVEELLRDSCLVVAHPDDEILWFSSILARVGRVVVCFLPSRSRPKLTRGRQAVLADYPVRTIAALGLEEANVYDRARWPYPDHTAYGLELRRDTDRDAARRYQDNFETLQSKLTQQLAGYGNVFTHNPWGEYGHEEHVQVHRAVKSAQEALGFSLWCSNYVSSRSHNLMARGLKGAAIESFTLETDRPLARDIAALFKTHGAWTWFEDYQWPERESFLLINAGQQQASAVQTVPLNFLEMGAPAVSLADMSLRGLARKLARRAFPGSKFAPKASQ